MHQNMVFKTYRDARDIARGNLDMSVCHHCGFVFNAAFDENKVSYDEHYDNTQCHSAHFLEHMDKMAQKALQDICKQGMKIVEVGCGKGDFLKKLVADTASYDSRGYGFDPTYVGPDSVMDGRVQFEKTFYGSDCTAIDADLVVSRHVIEHIKNPRDILNDVASGLKNAGNARICFETPDVTWIFKNKVIWDFFYEHCSLFTPYSLSLAFDRCGLDPGKVETVFGDQYLWITSHKEQLFKTPAPPDMTAYLAMVEAFESHYDHYLNDLAAFVQKQKNTGRWHYGGLAQSG